MLDLDLKRTKISIITKIATIVPIILLVIGLWNVTYVDGYYIHVEGSLSYMFPMDQSMFIIIDTTNPGIVDISTEKKIWGNGISVEYKGELPEVIKTYTEDNYFVIEGPLPPGSEINSAFSPKYEFSREVKLATDDLMSIFGINAKTTMEFVTENIIYASIGIVIFEFLVHRHNKKHNQITVINVYKTQIVNVKQEIMIFLKHQPHSR